MRTATISRSTKETSIEVSLVLRLIVAVRIDCSMGSPIASLRVHAILTREPQPLVQAYDHARTRQHDSL